VSALRHQLAALNASKSVDVTSIIIIRLDGQWFVTWLGFYFNHLKPEICINISFRFGSQLTEIHITSISKISCLIQPIMFQDVLPTPTKLFLSQKRVLHREHNTQTVDDVTNSTIHIFYKADKPRKAKFNDSAFPVTFIHLRYTINPNTTHIFSLNHHIFSSSQLQVSTVHCGWHTKNK
jgi:hypothetical protein